MTRHRTWSPPLFIVSSVRLQALKLYCQFSLNPLSLLSVLLMKYKDLNSTIQFFSIQQITTFSFDLLLSTLSEYITTVIYSLQRVSGYIPF